MALVGSSCGPWRLRPRWKNPFNVHLLTIVSKKVTALKYDIVRYKLIYTEDFGIYYDCNSSFPKQNMTDLRLPFVTDEVINELLNKFDDNPWKKT